MNTRIQNPGSALGEALGAQMEQALKQFLQELCEKYGYQFNSSSLVEGKKKLFLYDNFGTAYNIDAVISDASMHPLILVESKYIRYKNITAIKEVGCVPRIRRSAGTITAFGVLSPF